MASKPLQKLGGDSPLCPQWRLHWDCEFNAYVSYVLTLINAYSTLVCTHFTWFVCPLTAVGDEWEDGRLHSGPNLSEFIPPTHNWCHRL